MNTKLLRQQILDLAIRGKLVKQDPNDEPASVLLERIRAEKEQLIQQGKIKKTKAPATTDTPHYQNTPFDIPASWQWVRLGDIAVSKLGKTLDSGRNKGNPYDYLCAINVKWGSFDLTTLKQILLEDEEKERYLVRKGDLLICEGGDVGRSAIWESNKEMYYQNAIHRVRFYGEISQYYFLHLLEHYKNVGIIDDVSKGVTIKHFTQNAMQKILFPLPPLAEQRRIVAEVEKWFALIDDLETNKQDLQVAIRQVRAKVLDLAIHGKLVPQDPNDEPAIALLRRITPHFTPSDTSHYQNLPRGWEVTTKHNLCQLADGEKQTNILRTYLDVKYLRKKGEGEVVISGKFVPADSTMILVDGENSGEIFTTFIEGYQGSTFKLLNITENMYKPFVLYVIKSLQKQFRENKVGSAIPHFNKKLFREISVLVPPIEEQKRIVNAIDTTFEVIDTISTEL